MYVFIRGILYGLYDTFLSILAAAATGIVYISKIEVVTILVVATVGLINYKYK